MSFESELRRAAWKNSTIFAVGVVAVAFGIFFLSVYGDPSGPIDDGHLDVNLTWRSDGALSAELRTPFTSRAENQRVADLVLPALLGDPTELAVSYPEDKGGTHSVAARTLTKVAPPDEPLDIPTNDLVEAAQRAGLTSVDFSLMLPSVPASVTSSATPTRYGEVYEWNDVQDLGSLEVSASLSPSNRSWLLQTAGLVAVAAGCLAIAIWTGRRGLGGVLPERRARRRYVVGMGLSAVGLMWGLRVGSLYDDPDVLWQLDGMSSLVVHWGAALLWVFVGVWITFALLASSARDDVRRRFPPPPASPAPGPV